MVQIHPKIVGFVPFYGTYKQVGSKCKTTKTLGFNNRMIIKK